MGARGGLARRRGGGVAALWRARKRGRAAGGWDWGCGAACWGAGGSQILQRFEEPAGLSLGVPHLSGPSSPPSPPASGTSALEAPMPSRLHPSELAGSWPRSSSGSVVPRVPRSQPPALPRQRGQQPSLGLHFSPGAGSPPEQLPRRAPAPRSLRRWQRPPAAMLGQEEGARRCPCHPNLVGSGLCSACAKKPSIGLKSRASCRALRAQRCLPLLMVPREQRARAGSWRQSS